MSKKSGIFKIITLTIGGFIMGGVINDYFKNKVIEKESKRVNKFKSYYNLQNQWLTLKQEGKSIEQYFIDHEYKSIAIYGMGEIGDRLFEELKGTSIQVKYAIDKNAGSTYSELDVYTPHDNLEEVDAIIVTAIFAFEEIEKELNELVSYPVISLEDVLFEL